MKQVFKFLILTELLHHKFTKWLLQKKLMMVSLNLLKIILVNGRKVLSLAFTVDKKHKNYFQDKEIQTKAKMISNAHGFLGSCEEYFQNTLESLSELNIVDSEMTAISNYLKKN